MHITSKYKNKYVLFERISQVLSSSSLPSAYNVRFKKEHTVLACYCIYCAVSIVFGSHVKPTSSLGENILTKT